MKTLLESVAIAVVLVAVFVAGFVCAIALGFGHPGKPPTVATSLRAATPRALEVASPPEVFRPDQNSAPKGFELRDESIRMGRLGQYEYSARLTNGSGKSIGTGLFDISFFDRGGVLIGKADLTIQNFAAGDTKTISTRVDDLDARSVWKTELQLGYHHEILRR